jgi:hypothetical protein
VTKCFAVTFASPGTAIIWLDDIKDSSYRVLLYQKVTFPQNAPDYLGIFDQVANLRWYAVEKTDKRRNGINFIRLLREGPWMREGVYFAYPPIARYPNTTIYNIKI